MVGQGVKRSTRAGIGRHGSLLVARRRQTKLLSASSIDAPLVVGGASLTRKRARTALVEGRLPLRRRRVVQEHQVGAIAGGRRAGLQRARPRVRAERQAAVLQAAGRLCGSKSYLQLVELPSGS